MIYIMWFHNKSQPCKIGLLMLSRETGLDFVGILQKDFLSQWDLIFRQYPICHDTGLQKVSKPLKMHFCHLTLLDWSVKCTQESNGPPQSQSTNKNLWFDSYKHEISLFLPYQLGHTLFQRSSPQLLLPWCLLRLWWAESSGVLFGHVLTAQLRAWSHCQGNSSGVTQRMSGMLLSLWCD